MSWFQQGGVAMVLIAAIGLGVLYLIGERFIHLHRAQIKTADFLRGLFTVLGKKAEPDGPTIVEAVSICDQTAGPVARMVRSALLEFSGGRARVLEVMEQEALSEAPRLERRLGLLLLLAQCAPLCGLLGTITGFMQMARALVEKAPLVHAGDLGIGLWQALITTGAGLTVAIVAYAGHGLLVARVENILLDMERAYAEVNSFLRQREHG